MSTQRGMALLVVMSAIAFLLPLLFSGLEMGRFHLRRVQNERDLQEARRHAESGLSQVIGLLKSDTGNTVDHLGEPWALMLPTKFFEGSDLTTVVEDSARYLNLNDLILENGTVYEPLRLVVVRLLRSHGLEESLMDSLIDWLDADDIPTGMGGAERGWYVADGRPFGPNNGSLMSLEDLVSIRGWSWTIVEELRPFIRVITPQCRQTGININTASRGVLELLNEDWDVEQILERRIENPVSDPSTLTMGGGSPLLRVKSDCFEVKIRARVAKVSGVLNTWMVRSAGKVTTIRYQWSG